MLTIVTNSSLTIPSRSNNNRPELRQKLILEKIKNSVKKHEIKLVDAPIEKSWLTGVHDADYLNFLEECYDSWLGTKDQDWCNELDGVVPNCFTRTKPKFILPIYKLSGYYGSDYMSPIYEGTYQNAMVSANQAFEAANLVNEGYNLVYALTSSPGHHASFDQYGGYCYINNAMVAAYRLLKLGKNRVAILDLDFHAGDAAPKILRNDSKLKDKIFACSIHAHPINDYPSFEGFFDASENNILNLPILKNCDWTEYEKNLEIACQEIKEWNPDALVIPFGADTYKDDPDASPLARFKLERSDYDQMAKMVKQYFYQIPIIVTQEGGYDLDNVPEIVYRFLSNLQ